MPGVRERMRATAWGRGMLSPRALNVGGRDCVAALAADAIGAEGGENGQGRVRG